MGKEKRGRSFFLFPVLLPPITFYCGYHYGLSQPFSQGLSSSPAAGERKEKKREPGCEAGSASALSQKQQRELQS